MLDGKVVSDREFGNTLQQMSEELFAGGHYRASMHALTSALLVAQERTDLRAIQEIAQIAQSRVEILRLHRPLTRDGQPKWADYETLAGTAHQLAQHLRRAD
jgi:hypothetical protein